MDNGSVYTKNLTEFLSKRKIKYSSFSHFDFNFSKIHEFNSIILSGRRKNSKEMNALNSKLISHAISEKKPLLGICYGAEILALTLGGTIKKTPKPCIGEQEVIVQKENPLCTRKIKVFESHNYEISRLNDKFHVIAESENCLYEIVQYENSNIFGTQFHPEMSNNGQILIENFALLE